MNPATRRDGLLVRPAEARDVSAIAGCEAESHTTRWLSADFAEALRDPSAILLVALSSGVPVGHALGRVAADELEILTFAVTPSARRQKVGRALVTALLSAAESQGARRGFLEVREKNQAARGLYRGAGFTDVGRRASYYADGEDAIVMARDL